MSLSVATGGLQGGAGTLPLSPRPLRAGATGSITGPRIFSVQK